MTGAVWIFGSYKLGWWRQPDALFTFLLLMTNATPTGNQVQVKLQMVTHVGSLASNVASVSVIYWPAKLHGHGDSGTMITPRVKFIITGSPRYLHTL